MMKEKTMINEIKKWFDQVHHVELEFPGQRSRRPGDSWYSLENIMKKDGALVIELDEKRKLIFTGDVKCDFTNNCLEISNFDQLIFEWHDEVSPGVERFNGKKISEPGEKIYDEGIMRFIPPGSNE